MAYPQLLTETKNYSTLLFNSSNEAIDYPSGTTFSALTSDFNVATASVSSDGKTVTVTPTGTATGNVYVDVVAIIPGNTADITGTILVHVMEAPLTEKEYIVVAPC